MAKEEKRNGKVSFNKKTNFEEKISNFSSQDDKFSSKDDLAKKLQSKEVASNKARVKGISEKLSHKDMSNYLNNQDVFNNDNTVKANSMAQYNSNNRKSEFIHKETDSPRANSAQGEPINYAKNVKVNQFASDSNRKLKESHTNYKFNKLEKESFVHHKVEFNSPNRADKTFSVNKDNKTVNDYKFTKSDKALSQDNKSTVKKEKLSGSKNKVFGGFIHSSRFEMENRVKASPFVKNVSKEEVFIKETVREDGVFLDQDKIDDIKRLEIASKVKKTKKQAEVNYDYKVNKQNESFLHDDKNEKYDRNNTSSQSTNAQNNNNSNQSQQFQNQSQNQPVQNNNNVVNTQNNSSNVSKANDVKDNVDIKKKAAKVAVSRVVEEKKKNANNSDDNVSGDAFKDWKGGSTDRKIVGTINAAKNLTLLMVRSIVTAVKSIFSPLIISFGGLLIMVAPILLIGVLFLGGISSFASSNEELNVSVNGDGTMYAYAPLPQNAIDDYISQLYQIYGFNMTPEREHLLRYALSKVGCAYNMAYHGRLDVDIFDCSSLCYRTYREIGIDIASSNGYTSGEIGRAMDLAGKTVTTGDLLPGDILLYYNAKHPEEYQSIWHSAIYLGRINIDGNFVDKTVEALGKDYGVVLSDTRTKNLVKVCRPLK